MSTTVLSIYNAAISAAGGKGRLSSLSTRSKERDACDTWYEFVRDSVQQAAYWPCTKTTARLTLASERAANTAWADTDPQHPYSYRYALPNFYLRAWHLHDFATFELSSNVDGTQLFLDTNTQNAVLTYARVSDNPALWEAKMRNAVVWALAAHISSDINGKLGLRDRNMQLANDLLLEAQAASATQQRTRLDTVPPNLAARGGSFTPETRFYYQHGALFGAGTSANV